MTENEKQTEVVDIRDIIPDDHNFNKGTEKGREMIEKSFRELGAGRSILLDKNNRIIAGNKSQQVVTAMCSIGDENVTFQYSDGKTETETFADVVEMARLYILTDCNGSFETFSEWGLIRAKE